MELKIIDEKSGNPLKYFADDGSARISTQINGANLDGYDLKRKEILYEVKGDYPRHYERIKNLRSVMNGILSLSDLEKDIDCLEVGAGGNRKPSQALSQLGARVITLDADWEDRRHTEISYGQLHKMEKELGSDLVIPRIGGRNKEVICYMGDVAFLRDKQSALKDSKFDLIYFWGSLYGSGICSSVNYSQTPLSLGIEIPFKDRILAVVPSIKDSGVILAVSAVFNGHSGEKPEEIGYNNKRLADLALYWATAGEKKGKIIGIVGQSNEVITQRLTDFPEQEIQEHILSDPLERIIESEENSLFGTNERLRRASEVLNQNDRAGLGAIGMIDAVFVKY